ncbi:MAG: hypothetical protein EOP48_11440, partial [Sphingobacteriales bacterium]
MSNSSNVYSQGGGGTHYEMELHTAFFVTFLLGVDIPGLSGCRITTFRQQASSLGYTTDDLFLTCSDSQAEHRVLFQFKHNITISENSELFKEVLGAAWKDFTNPGLFSRDTDKVYLVKSALTQNEKNHLKQILNWAKVKATAKDFLNEVIRIKEKDKYYSLFKTTISQFEPNVTDEQVFHFLRCFDLLEYDFGNVSSVSKNSFLSLIQIAKASDDSAESIWNAVLALVSDSNSKGGYYTINSVPAHITVHFSVQTYPETQKKLYGLSQQSFEILNLIDDTIGGIKLQREDKKVEALEKFNNNRILMLTGDPGAGKSAAAKALLLEIKQRNSGYLLFFKADQLNAPSLRNLFTPFDIELTLKELFSYYPLYNDNVIYIDAAEKLLEGEGLAFKQLLKATEDFNIKIVISCRKANLNLIELKFLHQKSYAVLDVPMLDDTELVNMATALPVLKAVIQNKRILPLLRVPKYLDYAFKAIAKSGEDYSEVSEQDFINKLWAIIVENRLNENNEGLPAKRSRLFIDLSVARARMMQPFVLPPEQDDLILEKLHKDNVIVEAPETGKFAPAHDVLEDWALIRFVNDLFQKSENDVEFFNSLGTHPA